jgi:hypothetical protein
MNTTQQNTTPQSETASTAPEAAHIIKRTDKHQSTICDVCGSKEKLAYAYDIGPTDYIVICGECVKHPERLSDSLSARYADHQADADRCWLAAEAFRGQAVTIEE